MVFHFLFYKCIVSNIWKQRPRWYCIQKLKPRFIQFLTVSSTFLEHKNFTKKMTNIILLSYCLLTTHNKSEIAIFKKYHGKIKRRNSVLVPHEKKGKIWTFECPTSLIWLKAKAPQWKQSGDLPINYLSNYLKCLLCFGCGDIVTTMKTLLKQEDIKFIKCSLSSMKKGTWTPPKNANCDLLWQD